MGLAIAREIMHAHGEDIWVRSKPGQGSEFCFSLPIASRSIVRMSAGRILVIDDDPQIRRAMRTTLTARGYEVGDARTGEEGLEKLRTEPYDLVLLDMNMPGIGGLETCRLIRSGSDIAIIMLTVSNTEKDKVEALDAGADDYVTKPFSTPELLARIRATLRRLPQPPDHDELQQLTSAGRGDRSGFAASRRSTGAPRTSRPRNSICFHIFWRGPTRPSRIGSCCRRFGVRTTATNWNTCGCS